MKKLRTLLNKKDMLQDEDNARILCAALQLFHICSRIKKSKVCKILLYLSHVNNIKNHDDHYWLDNNTSTGMRSSEAKISSKEK